jgi:hypothetical protein
MRDPIPTGAGQYLDGRQLIRFWSSVDFAGGTDYLSDSLASATGECWIWRGSTSVSGYGNFAIARKVGLAHRIAFFDFGNSPATTLDLDHLCRNRGCINPSHLESVTHAENVARGTVARKTHCKHGHEFTESNTRVIVTKSGRARLCRTCRKAWGYESYQRSK